MKKLLLSLICLSIFIYANGQTNQIQTVNRTVEFVGKEYNKSASLTRGVTTCLNDTVEYALAKATGLQSLNINNATSAQGVSQYFNAPQNITVHGATFYAYKLDATGGISLNATVSLFLAGPDSLPMGAALATGTVTVDTTFGGGSLPVLEKNISFSSPILVSQPYLIVVGNYSANGMGLIFNSWTAADGNQEWLANVDIAGSWLRPYDVNVGGSIFDADVIISPHVSYDLTADFTPNRTIFNSTPDTIVFTDNSSLVLKDRMYNQAAFMGTPKLSYTYDFGDGSPTVNAIDTNHIFAATQNYSVTLSDTIYGWRTNCIAQETKMISMPSTANLVITEIMYNGPESGTDTTEFIEIYNNGSTTVDLTNYTCTGGIYTFPSVSLLAGEYYIIAINSGAFNNVFGFMPDGQFSNGLSNAGESIVLKDSFGNVVDSVFYDDVAPWPSGATAGQPDGGGSSIILCDVNADNNDGNNWKPCTVSTGVIINGFEVLANPGFTDSCCPIITVTNTSPTLSANQSGAVYQWIDCDNGNAYLAGETNQVLDATTYGNGNYAVEITLNGCVDTSACENVTGVGIKQNINNTVSIYPNPTSGVVNINLSNNSTIVNYSITTIEGKVVEIEETSTNSISIDLSKEVNGIYFIKINTENSSTVYKLIKQ